MAVNLNNVLTLAAEEGIRTIFGRKGEDVVEMNIKALRAGCEYAKQNIK